MIVSSGLSMSVGTRLDRNDIRKVGTSGAAHRGLRAGFDGGATGGEGAEAGFELNLRNGGGAMSRSTTVGVDGGCGGVVVGKG